ncbi:DUF1080 domain-containing protein [Pricia sp.]|uniref:3-keto-disaccharide hydrolase n=1 Tax=Pricia sp. TaxID=2268138 RepID=UPI0035945227
MKKSIIFAVLISLFSSCSEEKDETASTATKEIILPFLPFTDIALDNTSSFADVTKNWKISGDVYADRSRENTLIASDGEGILVNQPDEQNKGHLFTDFEHGDMELEIDVMMPKGSNSGLYFQGRYEVQLLDSWGVEKPQHSDIGGIYHRWDDSRGEGKEGYEGYAPRINAAKAPGLWQHFKIIFHAPKFDRSGKKTDNAEFEEVWLNGVLVQKNIQLTGPTRASAYDDEKAKGPLMVQGDHGAVALKNMKYKLYDNKRVGLAGMTLKEYESDSLMLRNLDSLEVIREVATDTISAAMASGKNPQKILSYTGKMVVPESGDYLFDYRINEGGGILIIDKDTVVNLDGDYKLDSLGVGIMKLTKGEVPFQLIYNKHKYWKHDFSLEVEGPGLQKQALHAPSSVGRTGFLPEDIMMVDVADEVELQRSFWMHDGKKRTHVISVGTPQGIHYAYDLVNGALLQVWNGDFFDATEMWLNRGEKQLGLPAGFTVSFHGDPEFAALSEEDAPWPEDTSDFEDFTSTGYTLDSEGLPSFKYTKGSTSISDKMTPSEDKRSLTRSITATGSMPLSHKIAEGVHIAKLPNGTFIVNDESYYINFPDAAALKPVVRKNSGNDELIVNVPGGDNVLTYTITW